MESKVLTNRYLTVALDIQPEGMSLAVWLSTVEFWSEELSQYPHYYYYFGEGCKWHMHSATELTIKIRAAVAEYADKICKEQTAINANRKAKNR